LTKYNGDCIVTSDICVENNLVTANKLVFDSYKYIVKNTEDFKHDPVNNLTDSFYDAILGVSNSFAEKTNLRYDHAYVVDGHPNPMVMGTCPMSYKIYYVPKNKKKVVSEESIAHSFSLHPV